MIIAINYKKGNPRLQEGIELAGHEVRNNIWDIDTFISERIKAAIFEFKYIFKEEWKFLNLAFKLRQHGIPVVTWNVDSPWNAGIKGWKVKLLLKSKILSLYATHSLQNTEKLRRTKVVYLPNAAWTSKYNLRGVTLEDLNKKGIYKWDVSFIGNMDSRKFNEHKKRVEFLENLGNLLKKGRIKFLFVDGKDLSFDEQVKIIQRSKINLSCISAADCTGEFSWGLPERWYGIPACGGFLLAEDRVHARDDFVIDEEVITYSNIEDCIRKIFYYLDRHEKRRRIAENAYQRVMKEHTYKHRAIKLILEIQNLKRKCDSP